MNERVMATWRGRASRRRVLAGMGGSVAVGFLAACSGNGGGQSTVSEKDLPKERGSDLLAPVNDTSAQATPGGIAQYFEASDIQGFDPHRQGSARTQVIATFSYPRLLKRKTRFDGKAAEEVTGDLAESWEFSPDGLQLTFKLRQAMLWDRRAPTNGRPVDSADVKFSADRFAATSPNAVNFFNARSKAAPITAVETPDPRTVVLKLAFPYVPLLATFTRALNMWILPREAEGGFNPQTDARGAGPWILEKYTPSADLEFRKNPDYYVQGRPFLDGWSAPIVTEYAQRLAQFRAGSIWGGVVKQEDVLATKKELPQLLMTQGDYNTDSPALFFGYRGPLKDARLRQAISYLIDRDLIAETLSDSRTFEAAGLPRSLRINSHIGAGWPEWLDPMGSAFGANAKFWKRDVAEAKRLAQAAGVTGKPELKFFFPSNGYSATYQQTVPILAEMINEAGIWDVKLTPVDYQSEYIPKIHFGGDAVGAWDGVALTPAAQGDDAGHQLQVQYHSRGAASRQPPNEDPRLDEMIDAQLREPDTAKRASMIQEIQRYLPTTMIAAPVFYQGANYGLSWPWVGNAGAVRGGAVPPQEVYPYLWFDKATYERTKP